MPVKYTLLPGTTFSNPNQLDSVICLLLTHGKITRTQYATIHKICANSYPVTLEIAQRMPKQMLYITKNGEQCQINNRSKINYIYS